MKISGRNMINMEKRVWTSSSTDVMKAGTTTAMILVSVHCNHLKCSGNKSIAREIKPLEDIKMFFVENVQF